MYEVSWGWVREGFLGEVGGSWVCSLGRREIGKEKKYGIRDGVLFRS